MARMSRRTFVGHTMTLAGAACVGKSSDLRAAGHGIAGQAVPLRPFGRTGARVPVVGLGGGSRFYEPIPDDELGAELVRRAIDRGVTFVETSANYGAAGESERRIGMAMGTHRDKVFLETKVDARDYDGAMREIDRSLTRLRTDRLDLLLHHFLRTRDELARVAGPSGAERAIREMVDQRVVRFRGLSSHSPALALEAFDRLEPDAAQLPVNAVRVPDFEPDVLPVAEERGIAVVAMKTCGHGYFRPAYTTRPDRIEEYGAPSETLARADIPTYREYLHYVFPFRSRRPWSGWIRGRRWKPSWRTRRRSRGWTPQRARRSRGARRALRRRATGCRGARDEPVRHARTDGPMPTRPLDGIGPDERSLARQARS